MVLAGAGVVAAALLWGRGGALDGATSLVAFALLAALTALSVLWSIVPELSYIETGRTLAYLVVFAAAIAGARLAPRAVPGVIGGILLGAMLPVAYALASRIWPGVARRERALQPHRRALPVLERGRNRRGDRDPARTLARLATHGQRLVAGARLSGCRYERARDPAHPVTRRARRRGRRRDPVAGDRAAAAAQPAGRDRPVARRRRRRRLGAVEGPVLEEPPAARGEGGRRGRLRSARGADDAAVVRRGPRREPWAGARPRLDAHPSPREPRGACRGLCRPARRVHLRRPVGDDRRPRHRAHERDRGGPRSGWRPGLRLLVDARQVLARGGPGVRGPAGRGRGRRRLWRGAPAPPDRRRRHGARARLRAPDARRPRRRGRGADHGAAGRLACRGAARDRAAAATAPVRASHARTGAAPRLGQRPHGPGGAGARGRRLRTSIDPRLDLVHSRSGGAGAGGGGLRCRARSGRRAARGRR